MATPLPLSTPRDEAPIDRAMAILLADGGEAARIAQAELASATTVAARSRARGVLAIVELREGQLARGQQHLQAAADDIASAGEVDARTHDLLQHAQALVLRRQERHDDAQALLQALHARADERPDVDAFHSASALAVVLSMQGRDDEALEVFYRALALARRSGHDALIVNALNNLGSMHSDLYNHEDALPMLRECLERALLLRSRRQVIFASGNLAQCLCLMGRAAEALAVARQHLEPNLVAGDPPALQRDEEMAHALLDNGLVDEAQRWLGGPVHVDPLSNEMATARVWLLARIQLHHGNAGEALRLCRAQQASLEAAGETSTVAVDRVNLLRVAAQAACTVGEHDQAYHLLDEAYQTQDRLVGRAARARRLSLEIRHRLQQAERERDSAQRVAQQLAELNASLQRQIDENRRLQQRLKAQATEDALTGLPNRRHLFENAAPLRARAARRDTPMTVAMIDLDFFKRINDQHGHDAGDRVLRGFADLMRRRLRDDDLICRHGGEEFVALLPGAGTQAAAKRLEALRAAFATLGFDAPSGEVFQANFSAGVTAWLASESIDIALQRADQALYAAKSAGRACIRIAPPGDTPPSAEQPALTAGDSAPRTPGHTHSVRDATG